MHGIRARQKMATQERVLLAARTLFLARPYEEVGVRDIAAEAGVATGTVIGAFGSKADLLNTIVIEDFTTQFELLRQAVLGKQRLLDRVTAMSMACVRYQEKQLPLLRASLAHSWIRTQSAESLVRDAVRPIYAFIREELSTAQVLGDIAADAPLWVLTEMLFDVLMSAYRKMAYDGLSASEMEVVLRQRFKVILGGAAPGSRTSDITGEADAAESYSRAAVGG
jgi:AcrR family transcriptional regulator